MQKKQCFTKAFFNLDPVISYYGNQIKKSCIKICWCHWNMDKFSWGLASTTGFYKENGKWNELHVKIWPNHKTQGKLGLVPTIGLHKAYNRNWNGIHLSITKYAMVFKWNLTSASLHSQLWFMKCSQGTWELINIDWHSPTTNILSDITAHIVQSVKRTFLLIQTPYLGPPFYLENVHSNWKSIYVPELLLGNFYLRARLFCTWNG